MNRIPSDPENLNDNRAEWAAAALRHFQCTTGTDSDDALADLLCDLMHWADRNGVEFQTELGRAQRHYGEETDAPTKPTKPTTNAELLMECMEYSRFGPLAQAFIIDAVTKLAEAVAEADPAELAQQMEISPVHPASWQGVAKEIKAKFDKFYNRTEG